MYKNISLKLAIISLLVFTFNLKVPGAISQSTAPKWVIKTNYTLNEKLLSYASDGFGYILVDYQQNIEAKTQYTRIVTKILNTQGIQNASQIAIDYNPAYQKIIFHEIIINRNKTCINCYDISKIKSVHREKNLERHLYDDHETAFLALEGVQNGDIIDYSYSIVGINPLFQNNYADVFYLEFGVPVGCLNINISCNNSRKLNFKYFTKNIEPSISNSNGISNYHWVLKDIQAKPSEDDLPKWYHNYNAVEISDFQSWKEVREWEDNVFKDAINIPFINKKIIADINIKSKKVSDKVLQALHFVQNDIRYFGFENGINSLKPHNPNDVFDQRFGDCKDKSVLLCCILKALGVEAYPLLVNTGTGYDLPNRLPNPYQFNHVIVAYKIDGILSFVDPTLSLQGGELIDIYLPNYFNGLLLDGKSEDLLFIRFRDLGMTSAEYHFFIDDYFKPAILKVSTSYIGSAADQIRYDINVKTYEEIKKSYTNFYSRFYPNIAIKDSILFKEMGNNKIIVTESYAINDLWKKSESDSNKISAEFYPFLIFNALPMPTTKTRTTPININYPVNINENFYIHLPVFWDIKLEGDNIKTNYLEYSSHYTTNKKSVSVNAFYSLNTLQDSVETFQVADAIKYIEKINHNSLLLTTNLLIEEENTRDVSYSKIFLFVLMITIFGIFASKIYKQYNPLSKLDDINSYQNIGGFLILLVISTVIRPFYILFQLYNSGYFSTRMDEILAGSNSASTTSLIIDFELFFNALILVSTILSAILLLKKRTSFPIVASFIIVFSIIVGLIDSWAVKQYIDSSTEIIDTGFYRNLVAAIIWVPYLFVSKRCKNTFINYHPSMQIQQPKTENPSNS